MAAADTEKEQTMYDFGWQLFAHWCGDYCLQSGWMANNKAKRSFPALVHALVYSLPFFALFRPSFAAASVIIGSHFLIDRFRLARYAAYAKEFLAPPSEWKPWRECAATGFHESTPPFLAVWLLIIIDNGIHIAINALALSRL